VLCHATGWLIDRDPQVAQGSLRAPYLKARGLMCRGLRVFGRSCPAPDFAGAGASACTMKRVAY